MNFENLTQLAKEEVQRVRADLPEKVGACLDETPVFFERRPVDDDVAQGIEPDTLGLFDPGTDAAPLPHIRLWLENIWDYAEGDRQIFVEEVRTTLLHEIGHLVGWDEEDVEDRGLG